LKSYTDFPPSAATVTGRHSWCHACHSKHRCEYAKSDHGHAVIKARGRTDAYRLKARQRWQNLSAEKKTEINTKRRSKHTTRYRDPVNHAKTIARRMVRQAVTNGSLIKPETCQHHGKYGTFSCNGPIQGHHYLGYAQDHWLSVEWLCLAHHKVANQLQDDGVLTVSIPPTAGWEKALRLYSHACAYCGRKGADLTEDHVVALSQGGDHSCENIVPACLSCNSKKCGRALRKPFPGLPVSVGELIAETVKPRLPELKQCGHCGSLKESSAFRHRQRFGLSALCLDCERAHLKCSKCETIKEHGEFAPDQTLSTGRKSWCNDCTNAHNRDTRKSEDFKAKRSAYRQRPDVKAKAKAYNADFVAAIVAVAEKECSKCKELKPRDAFSTNRRTKCGLASWCKECVAGKMAERRAVLFNKSK
jgi:hypothetical protein